MAGGKATAKKDEALKVTGGQLVKTGQILCRHMNAYKTGKNTKGSGSIFALCSGKVYFTKKKTPHGRFRTFINVAPEAVKETQ